MTTILIVANPDDIHARIVQRALERRGARVSFLHVARLAESATLSLSVADRARAWLCSPYGRMHLEDVDTVWYRRQGRPGIPESVMDPDDQRFAQREWEQALDGVMLTLPARFINPVLAQRAAVKPRQLIMARCVGLRVPDTLITSDPVEAAQFIDAHHGHVVHKVMSPPRHEFAATQSWRERDREALSAVTIAPTLFQERIVGPADVRTTIIGEQVLSARVASSADLVDSRLAMDAPWEAWQLPQDVVSKLRRLMVSLGLAFGTVDLKMTPEGDYVFFEVNPQGQFLYIEILTGLPLSESVADFLVSGSPESVPVAGEAHRPPAAPG